MHVYPPKPLNVQKYVPAQNQLSLKATQIASPGTMNTSYAVPYADVLAPRGLINAPAVELFLSNAVLAAISNPLYPRATQSRISCWSPLSVLGNSLSVRPQIPAAPRSIVRTLTSDLFLHKVNSADLLKTSSYASLYWSRRLSRVERERKVKTENARYARVARENAIARKLKSMRIAQLYAERFRYAKSATLLVGEALKSPNRNRLRMW